MKKTIIFIMIAVLLVVPVMAKSLGAVEPIDWKTEKRVIKDDGIYNLAGTRLKEEAKAEIWIEKKEDLTYHVDSLVVPDTQAFVELFYDIPPDYIDYRSHTGKYEQRYEYGEFEWEQCTINESCGGYATLDVTLEYGTGSNTFTGAITGATWNNDGINVSLVDGTDYSTSADVFTLENIDLAWSNITISYTRSVSNTTNDVITIGQNVSTGLSGFFSDATTWFVLLSVVVIILIISLVIFAVNKFGGGNEFRVQEEEKLL